MSLAGKRIACFVALPHHTRFLWPVMDEAKKAGAETFFFTTLSDYPYERDLVKRGLECKLLQSYVTPDVRRRVAACTDAFYAQWSQRVFEWDGLKHWPLVFQNGLVSQGIAEYFWIEELIRQERPDAFIALHERNRWGKLLGHQARRHGLAYFTFQEGDYYENRISFSAHTEYSTALMLWGEDTARHLIRHKVSPNKVVLTGNTHLGDVRTQYFSKRAKAKTRKDLGIPKGKKVVLFLVGLQWGVIQNAELWECLFAGFGDDAVPVLKWHPKVGYENFQQEFEPMFGERLPFCKLVHNYDPYSLLAIADYCVCLGKTTLGVEALSFGKPMFSLPGQDGEPDHYAAQGISQSVAPPGNWGPLHETMANGVPKVVQDNVDRFLETFFYRGNSESRELLLAVLETALLAEPGQGRTDGELTGTEVAGRVSYILPMGDDVAATRATLVSLAQKVDAPDWELVAVLDREGGREALADVSGDVRVVDALDAEGLGAAYNAGAAAATGEVLVFVRPGIIYFAADGLAEQATQALCGLPIRNAEQGPYCLGIDYDFNSDPVFIVDPDQTPKSVGGGLLATSRALFDRIGGFDEKVANHLVEADLCLAAERAGVPWRYLEDGSAINYQETYYGADRSAEQWRRRIRFFGKWRNRVPKDDDYIGFAGTLLNT